MSYFRKRVQRQLFKLAMVVVGTASMCLATVSVTVLEAMERMVAAGASAGDVSGVINTWLAAWQKVRHLCDSNLNLNAERYTVRPHVRLSPILARLEDKLRAIQASPEMGAEAILAAARDAFFATVDELAEFDDWVKTAGREVDFDAARYEGEAARRAEHRWLRIAGQIARA
jgi:hypothetical protein